MYGYIMSGAKSAKCPILLEFSLNPLDLNVTQLDNFEHKVHNNSVVVYDQIPPSFCNNVNQNFF